MKKLIVFLILLSAIPVYGQVELARMSPAMVGGSVPVAAGGPNVWYWSGSGKNDSSFTYGHAHIVTLPDIRDMANKVTILSGGTVTKVSVYLEATAVTSDGRYRTMLKNGENWDLKSCDTITLNGSSGWVEVTLGSPFDVVTNDIVVVSMTATANFSVYYDSESVGHYAAAIYSSYCSDSWSWVNDTNYFYGVKVYVD
jgi:hypothetical protein